MTDPLDDAAVMRFLRAHPDFLVRHPDLYRHLAPPERQHGEPVADHMASMLTRARSDAADARAQTETLLDCERAGAHLVARVRVCVLALIAEDDIADWVESSLPGLLGIDAATLHGDGDGDGVPHGAIELALGGAAISFDEGDLPAPARATLHGAAAPLARYAAYMRIPGPQPRVLALACRDRALRSGAATTEALIFLGEAIGACLARNVRPRMRLVSSR